MQKMLLGLMAATLLVACQKRPAGVPEVEGDSTGDTLVAGLEERGADMAKHPEDDGFFDDYFYRFIQDSTLQYERIAYPLVIRVDGGERMLEEGEWRYDSIYSATSEYTLIYDGKEVVDHSSDSVAQKATMEVIDLKLQRVKLYHFARQDRHWLLTEVDEHNMSADNNHGFFTFYSQFANDEDFQLKHIRDPFYFKTYDGDNFEEIEGWVSAKLWPDYRTYLPQDILTNTIYDDNRAKSNYRTFVISSPSSGMNCTLVFRRSQESWVLVSMEN